MPGPRDKTLKQYLKNYSKATQEVYSKAIEKTLSNIVAGLRRLDAKASLQEVTDLVFFEIYTNWNTNFTKEEKAIISRYVTRAYRSFRSDKSIFGPIKDDVPAATFGVADLRTIEFHKRSDNFYLSKFITDEDTTKDINAFIRKEYLEGSTPIGRGSKGTDEFKKRFGSVLGQEDWKIERVINTTVNKLRNYAAVQYFEQVGIEEFEIVGISDERQCPYCAELQGYKFSVPKAKERIDNAMASEHTAVGVSSPFITSLYKPDELSGLSATQLQDQGIDSPPFHPNCRDVIIAVL